MKSLFLAVTLISLSLFAKVNAAPCFAFSDSYPGAYTKARAVFIGEVIKIEPSDSYVDGALELKRYRVTFKVEYSWKGAGFQDVGLPELVVISEQLLSGPEWFTACLTFPSFLEGKKYLVYANETKDKSLVVGEGNGSKPLWNATEDLKGLKKQEAPFQFRVG